MKEKVDIKAHILAPKHMKLSAEDAEKLLKTYNISLKQLPKIRINDAAIKDLNPEIGDVIKITRKSPTNNETVFYRTVING